jgi:S-methylmethionine-dependent homocysteine/selenocysteine methylase
MSSQGLLNRSETKLMMNRLSSQETLTRIEMHYEEVRTINAICINCNKRFTSMRAISMHLKVTASRHTVNFVHYGNYDKKTGLRNDSSRIMN